MLVLGGGVIRFVTHIKTRNGLAFIRILLIQVNSILFPVGKPLVIKSYSDIKEKTDFSLLYSTYLNLINSSRRKSSSRYLDFLFLWIVWAADHILFWCLLRSHLWYKQNTNFRPQKFKKCKMKYKQWKIYVKNNNCGGLYLPLDFWTFQF